MKNQIFFAWAPLFFILTGCQKLVTGSDGYEGNGESAVYQTASTRVRIGDNNYVAAVLTDVYGADAKITSLVKNQENHFGGPCDTYKYTQAANGSGNIVNTGGCINRESAASAQALPFATTPSSGYLIRVCDLLSQDAAKQNAIISRIRGISLTSTTADVPAFTSTDVTAIYRLFYSGLSDPTDEVVQEFMSLASAAKNIAGANNRESWAQVLSVICGSSLWRLQ